MPLTQQQQEQRLLLGHEGFYFTGGESLRVTSLNSIAGVTIVGAGRFLPISEFKPTDVAFTHTPNTDRTSASSDFVMGEGWLQSLTIVTSGGSPVVGGTYVRVDVVRGGGASSTVLATLVQGFLTSTLRLAWPGSPLTDPVSGPGRLRSITGTDPAAGAEISETVPAGARWRFVALHGSLVTDATVGNRSVVFHVDDGINTLFRLTTGTVQTASSTHVYMLAGHTQNAVVASTLHLISAPIELVLLPGYRIRSATNGLQAGDNWGAPQLTVEEWLEGA